MKPMATILSSVLKAGEFSPEEWEERKKSRVRECVIVKSLFCHIARKEGYTLSQIGRFIGIHHATVMWHTNNVPEEMPYDKQLKHVYEVAIKNLSTAPSQ